MSDSKKSPPSPGISPVGNAETSDPSRGSSSDVAPVSTPPPSFENLFGNVMADYIRKTSSSADPSDPTKNIFLDEKTSASTESTEEQVDVDRATGLWTRGEFEKRAENVPRRHIFIDYGKHGFDWRGLLPGSYQSVFKEELIKSVTKTTTLLQLDAASESINMKREDVPSDVVVGGTCKRKSDERENGVISNGGEDEGEMIEGNQHKNKRIKIETPELPEVTGTTITRRATVSPDLQSSKKLPTELVSHISEFIRSGEGDAGNNDELPVAEPVMRALAEAQEMKTPTLPADTYFTHDMTSHYAIGIQLPYVISRIADCIKGDQKGDEEELLVAAKTRVTGGFLDIFRRFWRKTKLVLDR